MRTYEQYGFPNYPDGLMRSSVNDMARYLSALQSDGSLDGARILDRTSVETLLTVNPDWGTDEAGQAVIFSQTDEVEGRLLIGHNGGDDGSSTEFRMDRASGSGVLILLHTDPTWKPILALQTTLHELGDTYGGR